MAVHTFLFSDIEGSTRLWEAFPTSMDRVIARHDELVHGAVQKSGGEVFKHTGDGMAAAFPDACSAINASIHAQQSLDQEAWGEIGGLKVRMGVHTGDVNERDGDYFGPTINHVARLMSAAHGGQVLVSNAAFLGCSTLPDQASLIDMGIHRLRDLLRADTIYQLRHPDLQDGFPPIKTEKSGNLPEASDTLLGRETELQQLAEYLRDNRLITLIGFGGTGKTRLALELGRQSVDHFRDGVWFQGLAPITDPEILARETASMFGIGEDSLSTYLQDKEVLFIIDNCEHLVAGAAGLVKQLLGSPGVRVVATSREALNLGGERTFGVPPLPVPDDESDQHTHQDVAAVQLFQRRAQACNPAFELTPDNGSDVARIVRRLDGIPLAIELAASRVNLLPPSAIAERLTDSFKLLKGGRADALPHHQTLELTIDWSYDMLDEDQQKLFRQLSVFRDGFALAAFAAVGGFEDEYDALDALGELVDKSLVQTIQVAGDVRYQMLEPLIQYGAARLTPEEKGLAKDRHALFFQELAAATEPQLRGPQQVELLTMLETEHDNFRAAMAWAVETENAELGQRISASLMWFWVVRRHTTEGAEWYDRLLALQGGSPGARANALLQAGFIQAVTRYDELSVPAAMIQEGADIFEELEDGQGLGMAMLYTAQNLWYQRDFEGATPKFVEIQTIMRAEGFEWGDAFCDWFLGSIAWFLGDLPKAREHYNRGMEIFEEQGDLALIGWSLIIMANIEADSNNLDGSVSLYRRGAQMMNDIGDRLGIGTALMGLGIVDHYRGETSEAERQIAEAQVLLREGSNGPGLSWALANSLIDTRNHDLMVETTDRYQASLELPADEWTRMVISDAEKWRERTLVVAD